MEQTVLALKYRPKNFDELIGQETVSRTLKFTLQSGNIGTGYLFSGLRGSGKTSSARIFAKSILCENLIDGNSCEECDNCLSANSNSHIDIIEMDGASNRKIDDIRDLIDQTQYKPSVGKYKIFIIDEVHMLTKEAFNALLKTLEEPPEYVKFILATTDPLKLPPTILSRTQHFQFHRIDEHLVLNHLQEILQKENISYEVEALKKVVHSGNGSLRDTLTLLQQGIVYCNGDIALSKIVEMLGLIDPEVLEKLLEFVESGNREELIGSIKSLEKYEAELILDEFISTLKSKLISGTLSIELSERIFRALNEGKLLLSNGSDSSFVLYLTFLKMVTVPVETREIVREVVKVEKREAPKTETKTPKPETQTPEEFFWNSVLKNILWSSDDSKISDEVLEMCIREKVRFLSFENGVISLEISIDGKCGKIVKARSRAIQFSTTSKFGDKYSTKTKCNCITREERPISEIPVVEIPTLEERPVSETPVVEMPVLEERPISEVPVVEMPVLEEKHVSEIPVVKMPTLEEKHVFEMPTLEERPISKEQFLKDAEEVFGKKFEKRSKT